MIERGMFFYYFNILLIRIIKIPISELKLNVNLLIGRLKATHSCLLYFLITSQDVLINDLCVQNHRLKIRQKLSKDKYNLF